MRRDPETMRSAILAVKNQRGLSYEQWSKKAQVGEATLRHFVNGISQTMTDRVLSSLAAAAGVSVAVMVGDVPDPLVSEPNQSDNRTGNHNPNDLSESEVRNLQLMVRLLREVLIEQQKTRAIQEQMLDAQHEELRLLNQIDRDERVVPAERSRSK